MKYSVIRKWSDKRYLILYRRTQLSITSWVTITQSARRRWLRLDFDSTGGRRYTTGVSGITRGLATLHQGGSRNLQWSETGMEDPQEDPLAVHCFCVCSGSALLGVLLLWLSRSMKPDLLSVLSIYPMIFLCVFIVYRRIVRILSLLLYSAICWCVLVVLV